MSSDDSWHRIRNGIIRPDKTRFTSDICVIDTTLISQFSWGKSNNMLNTSSCILFFCLFLYVKNIILNLALTLFSFVTFDSLTDFWLLEFHNLSSQTNDVSLYWLIITLSSRNAMASSQSSHKKVNATWLMKRFSHSWNLF